MAELRWRKSSRSGSNGGTCVELASAAPGWVATRDSKNPAGGILLFRTGEMTAFLAKVRAGHHDLP